MKKALYKDERYPVYGLTDLDIGYCLPDRVVEVSDDLWDEYERITELYDELQDKLERLIRDK
jgi:uncharacterized protein Usg